MEIKDKLSVNNEKFNQGAEDFEIWFNNNKNLFISELKALEKMVTDPENCISIGICNGLFAEKLGIKNLKFVQTLSRHPKYANQSIEEAVEGYKKGDYVVVKGVK
ncbi:MAG: hypothetical protein ACOC1M_02860 [Halanaerobium sp.]